MRVPPRLSLIIPAYNEVRSIRTTLEAIRTCLDERGWDYEIIVHADGDDGTREAAGQFALDDSRITVTGSVERRGKGWAVRAGVAASRGEIVGFLDADYKVAIEEIDRVLPWFDQGYDVVIGSRAMAGSQVAVRPPWYRRIGSRVFALGLRLTLGLHSIKDTQCGFKFFRAAAARDLFARQRIHGYMFDVEVLHLANRLGYRVKEVGVRWQDDGDSRLQLVAGNWRNLKDLIRIRRGARSAYPELAEKGDPV